MRKTYKNQEKIRCNTHRRIAKSDPLVSLEGPFGISKVKQLLQIKMAKSSMTSHYNNMYWGDERPEEIDERYLKGPKVTALCALNAKKRHAWAILV